eukprot:882763-Amphidinium_carterae.1
MKHQVHEGARLICSCPFTHVAQGVVDNLCTTSGETACCNTTVGAKTAVLRILMRGDAPGAGLKTEFDVKGMTCRACSSAVEKRLLEVRCACRVRKQPCANQNPFANQTLKRRGYRVQLAKARVNLWVGCEAVSQNNAWPCGQRYSSKMIPVTMLVQPTFDLQLPGVRQAIVDHSIGKCELRYAAQ